MTPREILSACKNVWSVQCRGQKCLRVGEVGGLPDLGDPGVATKYQSMTREIGVYLR